MLYSIKHRGPDDQGDVLFPNACLGHVRLSIIDLRSGKQPMVSSDNRYTIVFNGEIYNYKEIRKELLNDGQQFTTQSDTEVIIEIYRKYGPQGFSKLRGMYAFALWDNLTKSGMLVRDPLGIKPLFIHIANDASVLFGSEAKAILEKLDRSPELDISQLHLLMNFRYIPGDSSLFSGIKQLKPGTVLHWSHNSPIKYYNISVPNNQNGSTLDHLRDSVYSHLTSDVEVGCYLSGGIDSSTVAVLSKERLGKSLRTFTIDIGDDPNEAVYASETAKHYNFQNLQTEIDSNILQELNKLLWHLEVPKINALQNWQLAKFTSQYVKVVLSGLGGDELFLGYNMHKIMSHTYTLSKTVPSFISSTLGTSLTKLYHKFSELQWSENERSLLIFKQLGNWPTVYALIRNVWDNSNLRSFIYGERMLDEQLPNAFEYIQRQWPDSTDPVLAAAQFEWSEKLINDLLWQEDRVSMAHGLEVRTPLVDSFLYSHLEKLPRDILMRKSKTKAYMKESVSPILPNQILNRPKSGFQISSYEFFHQYLKTLADEQLSEHKIKDVGLFNYNFVKHVLSFSPTKKLRWHYFILYFMILTHLWVDIFESNTWSKKL